MAEVTSAAAKPSPAYVIGISGGSASGKSTLATALAKRWAGLHPLVLNQDSYFRDWSHLTPEERLTQETANHPDAVGWESLVEHVRALKGGGTAALPVAGTRSAMRGDAGSTLGPTRLLVVEGHLLFGQAPLRELLDLKLFLDVPPDERVLRRMFREAIERGGDLAKAIAWYRRDVLPNYRLHTEPTRQFADLVLPWTEAREHVIDLIAAGVAARVSSGD